MFDVTPRVAYKHVPNWHRDQVPICENIPVAWCDNKVDAKDRQRKAISSVFYQKKNLQFMAYLPKVTTGLKSLPGWLEGPRQTLTGSLWPCLLMSLTPREVAVEPALAAQ